MDAVQQQDRLRVRRATHFVEDIAITEAEYLTLAFQGACQGLRRGKYASGGDDQRATGNDGTRQRCSACKRS